LPITNRQLPQEGIANVVCIFDLLPFTTQRHPSRTFAVDPFAYLLTNLYLLTEKRNIMRSLSLQIFVASLYLGVAGATPNPSTTCPSSANTNAVFGIPANSKRGALSSGTANSPLHVRGGELHQPETVEDVDALILNAASNNQLVVIDFTASW
jgi:hypothetical protein